MVPARVNRSAGVPAAALATATRVENFQRHSNCGPAAVGTAALRRFRGSMREPFIRRIFTPHPPRSKTLARHRGAISAGRFMLTAFLCLAACVSNARTLTWTGEGFNNLWSNDDNWSPSFTPADGDILIFNSSNLIDQDNNNDLVNLRVASLRFEGSSGFSVNGNPILVDTDIVASQTGGFGRVLMGVTFTSGGGTLYTLSSGQLELRGTITLANSAQLIAFAFTTNIVISGAIVGAGDLVKLGEGALFLTGNPANTYSGSTLIREGRVHLAKPSAAQAISANVFIGDNNQFSALYDDLAAQYPPAMSVFIGDEGSWGITNGATVTNLTIYAPGSIRGTGLLTLGCDVEIFHGEDTFVTFSGIRCPVFLGSQTRTFNFNDGPVFGIVEFFVPGPIIGPGPGPGSPGIIQSGFGEMYFEGPNLYYGPTTIESGQLWIEDSAGLGGSGAGAETWVEGGTLVLNGFPMSVAEPIFMTGGDLEFAGEVTLTGALVISNGCSLHGLGSGSVLDISSVISGPDDFSVSGGIVRLSGSSANTFGGGSAFSRAFVQPDSFFGPDSATLELAKSGVTAVPVPVTVSAFDTNVAILRQLQNGGVSDVTIGHNGSWQLNGRSVTPTALRFTGDGYVDSQGGLLQFTNPNTNQLRVVPGSPANYTAQIFGLLSCAASTNIFLIESNLTLNVAAQISGGTIHKRGAGTLMLSSFNSFGGQLLVQEGLLFANANRCLGTPFAGTVVSNGATLLLNGTNMGWCSDPLTLIGNGIGGTNGALTGNLGPVITNGIFLAGPATINTPSNCFMHAQTAITGTGPLTKIGPGTLYFSGPDPNSYTGDTLVNRGTLLLGKPAGTTAIPSHLVVGSGQINSATLVQHLSSFSILGSVTVNRGGLWDLNGQAEGFTVGLLEGRPPLTLNGGGDAQTGASGIFYLPVGGDVLVNPQNVINASSVISGNIGLDPGPHHINVGSTLQIIGAGPECDLTAAVGETSSAADLIKGGGGTLRLSGNNSFTGPTIVEAGPLLLANNFALGSIVGSTLVVSNGTLALDGGLNIAIEALTLDGGGVAWDSRGGSNTWTGPITLNRDAKINVNGGGYLQVLNEVSGPGGLTKIGDGTLQFGGFVSNTYSGLTVVSNGVIEAGRTNVVSIPGDMIIGDDSTTNATATLRSMRNQQLKRDAAVTLHSSGVLDLFHVNNVPQPIERLRSLTGHGSVLIGLGARLIISNNAPFEFFGSITGSGAVTKNGTGAMTAWGDWPMSAFSAIDIFGGDFIVHGFIDTDTNSVRAGARLRGDGQTASQVGVVAGGALAVDSKFPDHQGGALQRGWLARHFVRRQRDRHRAHRCKWPGKQGSHPERWKNCARRLLRNERR